MSDQTPQGLRFGEFELDEGNALLTRAGRPVPLAPKALSLLCVLTHQPGRLIRKDALLDAVWGHRHVSESVLKTTISQLRTALGDDAARPRYIETASRLGYRFIGTIEARVTKAVIGQMPAERDAAGEQARAAAHPPAAPPVSPVPPIIGRRVPLERLRRAWSAANDGRRQLVWIAGDAGVGKTTLIEAFVAQAQPPIVARGQCVEEYGAGEPYRPVLEALGGLCRAFPDLPALMRSVAPTWIVQFPWLTSEADRAALQRELAGTGQERMVRELAELLRRFTQGRPLLLVTEDLHWSDQATLKLIDHFARDRSSLQVLWLGTYRLAQVLAEEHPLVPVRQELRLHRLYEEIALETFTESELGEYVESRVSGGPAPEDFVRRLHLHTDGLPLFVANVIDSLISSGPAGSQTQAEWASGPLPVPEDLTGAIERQIARLPADTRVLLEAASVCGLEFRVTTLADVLETDAQSVRERCDELTRGQYWLREGEVLALPNGTLDTRLAFRHALYQHVFYGRIGSTHRAMLHRRVARACEAGRLSGVGATPAELASHYERGHEHLAALRHYSQASGSALGRFAPREAANLTSHALSLLPRCPEGSERLELELELVVHRGLAYSGLEGIASANSLAALERARAICDILPESPQRALLLNGLSWTLFTLGKYGETLSQAKRIAAIAESCGDDLLLASACALMGVTLSAQGHLADSCLWLERGMDAYDRLGPREAPVLMLHDPRVTMAALLGASLVGRGLIDQARFHSAAAIELARKLGQPMARAFSLRVGSAVQARLLNPREVLRLATELEKLVSDNGLFQATGPASWLRGWAIAQLGEAQRGYELIMKGYEHHTRMGMYAACTEVLGHAADARLLLGDWDGARAHIRDGLALADRIDERAAVPDLLLIRAQAELGAGDREVARQSIETAVLEARRMQAGYYELKALTALAELEPTPPNLQGLASAYARATEGRDTVVCRRASELLVGHS